MMTARIGNAAAMKIIQRINAPNGMNAGLAALTDPSSPMASPVDAAQVRAQNVAADLVDRSSAVRYPVVQVYCEKIVNDLSEKFRSFSGRAQMAIELRHSQDNLNGLQDALELYADSITQLLDAARGDWGDGMFYTGGYEVALGAVKKGGKNFMQAAKITFQNRSEQELTWPRIFLRRQTGSTRRWRARTAAWVRSARAAEFPH